MPQYGKFHLWKKPNNTRRWLFEISRFNAQTTWITRIAQELFLGFFCLFLFCFFKEASQTQDKLLIISLMRHTYRHILGNCRRTIWVNLSPLHTLVYITELVCQVQLLEVSFPCSVLWILVIGLKLLSLAASDISPWAVHCVSVVGCWAVCLVGWLVGLLGNLLGSPTE